MEGMERGMIGENEDHEVEDREDCLTEWENDR